MSKLERRETRRYLEMFYILKFRELVSALTWFAEGSLVYQFVKCLCNFLLCCDFQVKSVPLATDDN